MRFLRKNRFSDSRFTGKKFLKAERGKFLKKMGMCETSPIQLIAITAEMVCSFLTSMTYRCSLWIRQLCFYYL